MLKENKNDVDYGTRSADFATVVSITDGYGTYFSSEERKGGRITFTGFGEEDWNHEKEGCYIDAFIVGNTADNRRKAKELCGITVREDPWFKKEDISGIFDSSDDFSFDSQVVCLTGDFDYGSKGKVTSYIESHGGTMSSSVTRKTTVVLVGNKGSDAWSHGNYGTKVEKAIERRETRDDIIIHRLAADAVIDELIEPKWTIKKMVVISAVSDLISSYYDNTDMETMLHAAIGCSPEEAMDEYKKRSAVYWSEKIRIPVLIIHSRYDSLISFEQAEVMYEKLRKTTDCTFIRHEDNVHGIHREDLSAIAEWLEKHEK